MAMGRGLAGEEKMKAVQEHLAAEGLVRVKIVAQQRVVAGGVTRGVGGQPALGRVDLAILLGPPVLRRDELRAQRHNLRVAGADHDRRDGAVEMSGRSVRVPEAGTMGAMDVFGLRGKIPGGIQRDEAGVADGAHLLQQPRLVESLVEIVKETEEMTGLNRIERLADVIVAGNAFDLKERAGVVATAGLFHGLLETQERRALGEKDRES